MGREQRAVGGVGEVGGVGVLLGLTGGRPEQTLSAVGLDGDGVVVFVVGLQQGVTVGQGRHADVLCFFQGRCLHVGQQRAGGAVVDLEDVVRRQHSDVAGAVVRVASLDADALTAGEVDEGVGAVRVIAAGEDDAAGGVSVHAPVEAAQLHGLAAVQIVEAGTSVLTALEAGDAHAAGRDGAVVFAGEQLAGGDVVEGFAGDAPV